MILLLLCTAPYFIVTIWIYFGFSKLKENTPDSLSERIEANTSFTIIIPFRNEATHLPNLLASILELTYPKDLFEVIFVDDHSKDNSKSIIETTLNAYITTVKYRIIKNDYTEYSPKKKAITKAIGLAHTDWIFTTDADCVLPSYLLKTYDLYIQKNDVVFISGPVLFNCNQSFVQQYQLLDTLSLQITTMGSFGNHHPFMCNGANMTYKKEVFQTVQGYKGNEHIASGDDIFLLQKIQATYPDKTQYVKSKDAMVKTVPQLNWKTAIQQRIRWAKKTGKQKDHIAILVGFSVLLINVLFVIAPFIFIQFPELAQSLLYVILLKLFVDLFLLQSVAIFFEKRLSLLSFIFSFVAYPFIFIRVLLGTMTKNYSWKGRTHKS